MIGILFCLPPDKIVIDLYLHVDSSRSTYLYLL